MYEQCLPYYPVFYIVYLVIKLYLHISLTYRPKFLQVTDLISIPLKDVRII